MNFKIFRVLAPYSCKIGEFDLPARSFEIEFIGIKENTDITVKESGKAKPFTVSWKDGVLTVTAENVTDELIIAFNSDAVLKENDIIARVEELLRYAETDIRIKEKTFKRITGTENPLARVADVCSMDLRKDMKNALIEILTADTYGA